MRVFTRLVRGRKKHPNWRGIVKEVERTIDTTAKTEMLSYPKRIVAEWSSENRPGFRAWKRVTRKEIAMGFYPTGGKGKQIWEWMRKGTGLYGPKKRKYPIVPVRKKALYFRGGYQAKTGLSGQYKGPGIATGNEVIVKRVMHPGMKPRGFEKHIARWYGPKFKRHIENAIRRGARRA